MCEVTYKEGTKPLYPSWFINDLTMHGISITEELDIETMNCTKYLFKKDDKKLIFRMDAKEQILASKQPHEFWEYLYNTVKEYLIDSIPVYINPLLKEKLYWKEKTNELK